MRYCNRKDLAPPCDDTTSSTSSTTSQTTSSESESTTSSSRTTTSSSETSGSESTTSSSTSSEAAEGEATDSSSGTTSSSSSSGECMEEGFHRDPNDCNKFYRCVDFKGDGQSFTRYDFECAEGLVFDESNNVCNWPSSVPSCQSSESSPDSGSSTTDSSSRGTSDSSSESSERDGSTTESSSTSDSSTTASSGSDRDSSTTESSSVTTESSSTTEKDSSTTERGTTGTTGSSSSSEESATDSGASTSSESGTTSSGSKSGSSSDNIECTEEGFFRHPDDCGKFYRCVDFAGTGESYVRYDFDCPEGLHFDEVNSVCNWPTMTPGCDTNKTRDGSGSQDSSSTTSSDGASETSSSDSPDGGRTTSQDGVTESTSSDSSTDESRGTTSSDSSTTSGDQTTSSSSSTTSSSSDDFQCKEEGFFKHPSDCKKYYECKRDEDTGELVKIDCECPDGQIWDNEGWYCNAEDLAPPCDSNSSSSSSFKCKDEGFFRDPEDCTKYYQCNRTGPGENDFVSEQRQCRDGTVFDEEGRYCNAPELSKPCDDSSSGSTGDGSTSDGSTTSSDGSGGESTTSRQEATESSGTSSSTSSSGARGSGGSGECTQEGFFRNPDDCGKFYRCVDFAGTGESFVRYDFDCPDGLHFDEVNSTCNWPTMTPRCESNNSSPPPE